MSEILSIIEEHVKKIKTLEAQIQQSIATHHGLLGMLQSAQEALIVFNKIKDSCLPIVEEAANLIDNDSSIPSAE